MSAENVDGSGVGLPMSRVQQAELHRTFSFRYSRERIVRRMSLMCCAAITVPAFTDESPSACRSVCMWMASTAPPAAGVGPGQLRFVPGCTALIASSSSVKCSAVTGVASGKRSDEVASVKITENVAATDRASFSVTVHSDAPLHAPLQPLKRAWEPGAAVSVTTVPEVKLAEQVDAQLMPAGLLVTAPAAEPLTVTLSVNATGGAGVAVVTSFE